MSPKDILLALAVVVVWGINFVFIKWAVAEVPPLLLTALRYVFAAVPAIFFVRRPVAITAVMASILGGSVVSALVNTGTYASMVLSPAEHAPPVSMHVVFEFFLGSYLGALTLAPPVLAWLSWSHGRAAGTPRVWVTVLLDCIKGVVPPLALLVWLAAVGDNSELTDIARMAMFLAADDSQMISGQDFIVDGGWAHG